MSRATQKEDSLAEVFQRAVSLHENGELPDAERLYQNILKLDRNHFGCLHHFGLLRAQQSRLGEALGLLELALAQSPDSAEVLNHAGSVLHAMKRHREALTCFEKSLSIDPDSAETHYNHGTALQALGSHRAAIGSYERALAIEPDIPAARYNLGVAFQALNRHDEAIREFEKALALEPDYARAHAARGIALQQLGRCEEAVAHYERALAIGPDDADTRNNLGLALQALDRHREAIAQHERALAIRPGFSAAHNNLGTALQALNRHDEAIGQYRKAVAGVPRQAVRYANLGLALQEIGRLDEACREFEKAIELAPRTGRFYRNLADCKRFSAGDPQLAAMVELAQGRQSLPEEGRRQLLFALAKAFADFGEHERAFGWLLEGNALKRQQIGYDEAKVLGEFARIQAVFDQDLMNHSRDRGDPSSVPIFILGMPRSGTTLVEQILASHSAVHGAGELLDFEREVARLSEAHGSPAIFPELVPSLSGEQLRQLGARYVQRVRSAAPAAGHITDKMPLNFFFVGLIHLALPNARIIHTRRDPVDTCLSCFATLFTGEHRVAYELGELGRYYRAYDRLMRHWRDMLPDGVMLEVKYEDLVADFEPQARRIVAHSGLEWEDACLDFHKTRRPVRTASAAQVRRPIYHSSVGRWQPYKHLLRPLLEALGVDDLPGDAAAGRPCSRARC